MNDDLKMSSFIGIPMTTTDKNGDESTYLSPAVIDTDTVTRNTYTPPGAHSSNSATSTPDTTEDTESKPTQTDTTESDASETTSSSSKTNIGPIIGGAVGGVVLLIVLGILGWVFKRKIDRKRHLEEHHKEEMQLLAMELDGSYKPGKHSEGGPFSEDSIFTETYVNGSITDDLASRYTGGSMSRHKSMLGAYSAVAQSSSIGTELTMDSQGRKGMPDGSPDIMTCIMPLRNVKAADNYTDLEWFPLVADDSELMKHSGPSYIEEKELSYVATHIQKPPQKSQASAGLTPKRL
ncbi:hypothetical protein IWW36_003795 [Coemansia brasiliensis]|uniref:Uncharacterized protein n=1 Tax=Coemansia brasiliensis TaxID=2650707 RepID=A0A9W8LZP1_9FUNG|nr:hypothetical protein IWW36_003795 [Coemansia brasiliensis]